MVESWLCLSHSHCARCSRIRHFHFLRGSARDMGDEILNLMGDEILNLNGDRTALVLFFINVYLYQAALKIVLALQGHLSDI